MFQNVLGIADGVDIPNIDQTNTGTISEASLIAILIFTFLVGKELVKGISYLFKKKKQVEDIITDDIVKSKRFKEAVRTVVIEDSAIREYGKSISADAIQIHSLEKAPLYKDIEFLKQQHQEFMERQISNSEENAKNHQQTNKILAQIIKELSEVKQEVSYMRAKIEDK